MNTHDRAWISDWNHHLFLKKILEQDKWNKFVDGSYYIMKI